MNTLDNITDILNKQQQQINIIEARLKIIGIMVEKLTKEKEAEQNVSSSKG